MSRYLQDCDVCEMSLFVPSGDERALLDFFDGSDRAGGGGGALSRRIGPHLKIEAGGGKLVLRLREHGFEVEEIRLFDDRNGVFFDEVVVALFMAYRGLLRCALTWSGAHVGRWREPLVIEQGRCEPPREVVAGRWQEAALGEASDEEILDKLGEARRLFEEYQRRKLGRRLLPGR